MSAPLHRLGRRPALPWRRASAYISGAPRRARHTPPPPATRNIPRTLCIRYKTMMRGAGGALAMAVAALIVCCSADSHQESDVSAGERPGDRYDPGAEKDVSVNHPGGTLVRAVRDTGHVFVPYLLSKRYDLARSLAKRDPARGGYYLELPKRNYDFDEIDLSGLNNFVNKRNFDEIDQTSMPFPYATKRFYHLYGPNHFDIDTPVSSFDKKRYRPDYPMDEIDLSHFPIGSKRSQDGFRPSR